MVSEIKLIEAQRAFERGELTPEEFAALAIEHASSVEDGSESADTPAEHSAAGDDRSSGDADESHWVIAAVDPPREIAAGQREISFDVTVRNTAEEPAVTTVGVGDTTVAVDTDTEATVTVTTEAPPAGTHRDYTVFVGTDEPSDRRTITVENDDFDPEDFIAEEISTDVLGLAARWRRNGRISADRLADFEKAAATGRPLPPANDES